jgi:class 3 adenylate cyclase
MEGPNLGAEPGARPLPSGVVTFLLSDLAGSTRLREADEEVAAAAVRRHYELLDAVIVLHGGVRPEEQGEGDSVVGAFRPTVRRPRCGPRRAVGLRNRAVA